MYTASVPVNKLKYALVHVHVAKYIILTFIVIINSDVFLIIIKWCDWITAVEKAVMENGYHPVEVVKELIHHNA